MYEICKKYSDCDANGGKIILWSPVAWTDLPSYAKDIVDYLNIMAAGEATFAAVKNGEVVYLGRAASRL